MQPAVTLLAWVLADAPEPTTTEPPPPPTRVDVEHTDDSIHVLAYDAEGDVTAEIVEWRNGADIRIDANFPDGVYLSVTVRAEDDVTIESNDPAAVSERIAAVEDLLGNAPTASKWMCALEVIAAGIACSAGGPVGVGACALGGLLVACACIPLIDDKIPDDAECFE